VIRRRSDAVLVLAAFVAALACASASAQAPTLTMTADRTEVPLGDRIRLQIQCSTSMGRPQLPDLSDFTVINRQESTHVQMTGGGMSVVSTFVFVLQPIREGRFTLTPAMLSMGRQTIRSNPLTIVVGHGGPAPTTLPPPSATVAPTVPSPPSASAYDPSRSVDAFTYDDRAFLRTVVDDREPYVGEQVTVTTYLYVRQQLSQWPSTTQEPTTDGFWVRDLLPPSRTPEFTVQQVQGVSFYVYTMRRVAAFPLRAGELTVGPMGATIAQGSPFDILMGQASPDLARVGAPAGLHARELPAAGRPGGPIHVGTLALGATLDRAQTPTGDAVTLTVRATGSGRIDGLELPELNVPGLRILAPHLETTMEAPGDRVGGTRTFEWLIVPEQPGTFTIPSFRVGVLDPNSGAYTTAASTPLTLTAAGNALTDPQPTTVAHGDTPEADETSTPLGPVRTQAALIRHRTHVASQPWYPYVLAVFPIGWVLLVLARAARQRITARDAIPSAARVAREARKRLLAAEERAKAGDARGFYGALTLAISAVIEGKLGESVGALTHRELERKLTERGMEAGLAKKICSELEGADFARYSTSGAAATEMSGALDRGRELLSSLDRFVATAEEE
jgi:hypothetical protein